MAQQFESVDDIASFPPEVQAMQGEPLHKFANPFIRMDSPKQEQLAETLRQRVCPNVERSLQRVPPFDPAWQHLAHEQFEGLFAIVSQTQKTVPEITLQKST